MFFTQTETKTRTTLQVSVALAMMLSISISALFYTGGLLVGMAITPSIKTEQSAKVVCSKINSVKLKTFTGDKSIITKLDDAKISLDSSSKTYIQFKSAKVKQNLLQDAQKRKQFFVESMYKDPESALFFTLSPDNRRDLEQMTQDCVEKEVVLEGTLEVIHFDHLDKIYTSEEFTLVTKDKKKIKLHPARGIKHGVFSGTKVKIKGFLIDDEMLFDGSTDYEKSKSPWGGIKIVELPSNPPVLGDQKFIVLMVNFQDTEQPDFTAENVRNVLFSKLNDYYQENSYQKISFSGDVLAWRNIPINKTCAIGSILDEAIKAYDAEIDFRNYARLIIFAPTNFGGQNSCSAAGVGSLDKTNLATGDGEVKLTVSWISAVYGLSPNILAHEIGHNFGNHHASFYNCHELSYAEENCNIDEYGDPYSIMGWSYLFHFNALHKEIPGWMNSSNMKTIFEDGDYILKPIEIKTDELQALKIPRTQDDYLFVEYRQPIGYDSGIKEAFNNQPDVFDGALIHVNDPSLDSKSWLIDPTPPGDIFTTALANNKIFFDPLSATSIKTISKDENFLKVNISIGKKDFIPPVINILEPLEYEAVTGDVKIRLAASDELGIEKIEVKVFNFGHTHDIAVLTSEPYEVIFDSTKIGSGDNYILIRAYDRAGEAYGVKGNMGEKITKIRIWNNDSEPPTIRLTSPLDGALSTNPVKITAEAEDNVGIFRVDFYDGVNLIFSDYDMPYEADVVLPYGEHALSVLAMDNVRNINRSQYITITTENDLPKVKIISPLSGALIYGIARLHIEAMDSDGISRIEVYRDGEVVPIGIKEGNNPGNIYFIDPDTKTWGDGEHSILARVYDTFGASMDSDPVILRVDNRPIDITVHQPQEGQVVSGQFKLLASFSGPTEFLYFIYAEIIPQFIGGKRLTIPSRIPDNSYEKIWDTTQVLNGSYKIRIVGEDERGTFWFTPYISFEVKNITFLRGDVNNDGKVDISDPVRLLDYLFKAGDDISCLDAGDANDDGELDISDAIKILLYLTDSEKVPNLPAPFGAVGVDPTADLLTCNL